MTGFGDEAAFIDALPAGFAPRTAGAREFAPPRRTLPLVSPGGIPIDVSLAALPFEDTMMNRSVEIEFLPGERLRVCSLEDLAIMKLFAGRDIDLRDARTVVIRRRTRDWDYIESNLATLDELRGASGLIEAAGRLRSTAPPSNPRPGG